jgi:PKD repeat protein
VDTGGDTLTYSWDFGDLSATSTSAAPTHLYVDDTGGPFTAVVTVSDGDGGTDTDSLTVTVNNLPPVVDAGPNKTAFVGDPVFFTVASLDDPGTADTHHYSWNFGDGNFSTEESPYHTYGSAAGWPVTLTAIDDDTGSDSDTLTVTVFDLLSISGAITGIPPGFEATVNLSGTADSTTTTTSGVYSFSGLRNGTYTVTPQLGGQIFNPADTTIILSTSDSTGNNFDIPTVVRFVDQDSPAVIADGMGWATAFTHPQTGSDAASSGEQVWVAEGSYIRPDTPVTTPVLMMYNGVEYYGGFDATEAAVDDRNPTLNPTILDGEGSTWQLVVGADNSLLSGFDVINAFTDTLNSSYAPVNASNLSNFRIHDCVISDNVTRTSGGTTGSSGLNISDGEVANCILVAGSWLEDSQM